jgi:hypothetical protein
MPRDVEDMMLTNLRALLSANTGIPLNHIWVKNPPVEYTSMQNGPNLPSGIVTLAPDDKRFPAIGINYHKDAKIGYNNYGESKYISSGAMVTEYAPLGEIELSLAINLFTVTKKEQRDYGTKIINALLSNPIVTYASDVIPGEYFSIKMQTAKESPTDEKPYHKIFFICCQGRLLSEVTDYRVDTIDVGLGVDYNVDTVTIVDTDDLFTTSSSGTTWFN